MSVDSARAALLAKVMEFTATAGIADKSLREIAAGVGTSHRMLLYHFGSREGLLAAIVAAMEARQRELLATLATEANPSELMLRQWEQLSDPRVRPFVRTFFAVVGLAVQGAPGTQALLDNLTEPWLAAAAVVAEQAGLAFDPATVRLGIAVSRGLLLDLLAGADPQAVGESYRLFVHLIQAAAG
jgi:AcrR family transcriptional regulator